MMTAPINDATSDVLRQIGTALRRAGVADSMVEKAIKAINEQSPMQPISADEVARVVTDLRSVTNVVPIRKEHLPLVSARDLWPPRQPEWLLRPYIPKGELTLLEGREGVGKGLFAAWVAKQLAAGELGEPRSVVWFSAEDDPQHTVVPRLHAAGWDPERHADIEFLDPTATFALPGDDRLLRERLARGDVGLVVFDPVKSFAGAIAGFSAESNNDMYVRRVTQPLLRAAQEFGVTVVMIGHWRKGVDVPSEDRSHGSVAWRAVPRAVVQLAQAPDGTGAVWLDKCNLAKTGHLRSYEIHTAEVDIGSGRRHRFPRLALGEPITDFVSLDEWMAAKRQAAHAQSKRPHADVDQFAAWLVATYPVGDKLPDRDGLFHAAFPHFSSLLLDLTKTDIRDFVRELREQGVIEYRPGAGLFLAGEAGEAGGSD